MLRPQIKHMFFLSPKPPSMNCNHGERAFGEFWESDPHESPACLNMGNFHKSQLNENDCKYTVNTMLL